MDIIKSIEHEQMKNKIPALKVGDTVRVHQRIKEGNRERIQVFEGIIIKKQGGGVNATFTVRRAKLYYLRDRVGKAAKTKEDIGARIENKEITIKEDLVEEPVAEEVVATEENVAVEEAPAPVVEETVEEVVETPVADAMVETANEELAKDVETVEEEAPVAEEETATVEEVPAVEETTTAEEVKEETNSEE